jgi:hypothetical protein
MESVNRVFHGVAIPEVSLVAGEAARAAGPGRIGEDVPGEVADRVRVVVVAAEPLAE